jgi:hypothetical protein
VLENFAASGNAALRHPMPSPYVSLKGVAFCFASILFALTLRPA